MQAETATTSWPGAPGDPPPPLEELTGGNVNAIADGWAAARAEEGGARFGGEWGPTTFDIKAVGYAVCGAK